MSFQLHESHKRPTLAEGGSWISGKIWKGHCITKGQGGVRALVQRPQQALSLAKATDEG